MSYRYTYLGDKFTRPDLRGRACNPVRLSPDGSIASPDPRDGKCIVSVQRASALVVFDDGTRCVVARRRLRLTTQWKA